MPRRFFPGSAGRASTSASHHRAVERVIRAMRAELCEHLSLQSLAEIAILSPFHFDRIFRQITGIPPCQFLGALRLEAAKRLLLTTQMSVTDICFEVGYNSLGTFITRFTQLVGLPPRRLRHLADVALHTSPVAFNRHKRSWPRSSAREPGITGRVESPDGFSGPVLVGLFPTRIPQGRPVACALLSGPGQYQMDQIPDGRYYAFAASFKSSRDPLAYLLPDDENIRVGAGPDQLVVKDGKAGGNHDIELRCLELTDPPLLIALPFLLSERRDLSSSLREARVEINEQMGGGAANNEAAKIAKVG